MGIIVASLAGGCQTSGVWKLAETDPPGFAFPLQRIEMDDEGRFRATTRTHGRLVQTEGAYRWRGSQLEIIGSNGRSQRFWVKRHGSGLLEFVHRSNGERLSAYFVPIDPNMEQTRGATPDILEGTADQSLEAKSGDGVP